MPGPGRVTTSVESELEGHRLGTNALDIWVNERVFWHAIPNAVWEFTVGGYQVIKKWLSYREASILGRDLTLNEARHVTNMVRRIAAILLLEPELNETYAAGRDDVFRV